MRDLLHELGFRVKEHDVEVFHGVDALEGFPVLEPDYLMEGLGVSFWFCFVLGFGVLEVWLSLEQRKHLSKDSQDSKSEIKTKKKKPSSDKRHPEKT